MSLWALLALGVLFGMQHATEADHLAAVATLVARESKLGPAMRQGVFWGLGHSLTLLLFGGAIMIAGVALSGRWVHGLEGAVGLMLVLLGADLLRRLWRDRVHGHAHVHVHAHEHEHAHVRAPGHAHVHAGAAAAGAAHVHAHAHAHLGEPGEHDAGAHAHAHRPVPLRALLVGMVHGMAGSAALVLLTLQQIGSPWWGLAYVLVFGLGSIAGMGLLSAILCVPMRLGAARLGAAHRWLNVGVAFFSVGLGLRVVAQQWT